MAIVIRMFTDNVPTTLKDFLTSISSSVIYRPILSKVRIASFVADQEMAAVSIPENLVPCSSLTLSRTIIVLWVAVNPPSYCLGKPIDAVVLCRGSYWDAKGGIQSFSRICTDKSSATKSLSSFKSAYFFSVEDPYEFRSVYAGGVFRSKVLQ